MSDPGPWVTKLGLLFLGGPLGEYLERTPRSAKGVDT